MRYYAMACFIAAVILAAAWAPMTASAYPQTDNAQIRQWVWNFNGWLPLESLDVTVKVENCPGLATAGGCYLAEQKIIYMSPGSVDKGILGHELGHVFDDQVLDDGNRNKIMYRFFNIKDRVWAPYYGQEALNHCMEANVCSNEMFADGFLACARHIDAYYAQEFHQWFTVGSYNLSWTSTLQKNLCKFIVKVGSRYHT